MRTLKESEAREGRTCVFETYNGVTKIVCGKPAVMRVTGGFVCQEHLDYVRGVRPETVMKEDW